MTVSQLAELSNLSKAYISQVKHGKRPPSEKLLEALKQVNHSARKKKGLVDIEKSIDLFLKSRRNGIAQGSIDFYKKYLIKAIPILGLTPTPRDINDYFNSLSCSLGGKHAYFRAISVFYNWLYSPKSVFNPGAINNPVALIDPPKRPNLIQPSLTKEQVGWLIERAGSTRDKAIVSLFAESGLRLSELSSIKTSDINWKVRIIKVIGKGNKEGYAPFGSSTEGYLKEWLNEYQPRPDKPIWNLGFWGIRGMLRELGEETGLPCNPHTFRRTFACLLRKAGVDTMTIKDLGRWESLEMVQRYTRSVTFQDSLKFYKAPLSL